MRLLRRERIVFCGLRFCRKFAGQHRVQSDRSTATGRSRQKLSSIWKAHGDLAKWKFTGTKKGRGIVTPLPVADRQF